MPSTFSEAPQRDFRILDAMRVGIRMDPMYALHGRRVGSYSAREMELSRIIEPMMLDLSTYLLTEKLGEERIVEERVVDHECIRFASWYDHWKATYRGRWWMRWRRWEVRYNIEHHPIKARIEVDMTKHWTFPEADIVPAELGSPMGYITNTRSRPWYDDDQLYWTTEAREEEQE
jgi:hypothetical protein